MINFKKLLLITLCVTMVFSCIPVLGADAVNTFLEENFNSDITGDMPVGAFKSQKAGGAEIGVVEVPDAKNKSVYLRGATGGTASLTGSVVNPELLPVTLSFRFMLPADKTIFSVRISDSLGANNTVLTISNDMLYCGGGGVKQLETKRWYLAELTFDLKQQTYRFVLDGETVMERFTIDCKSIDALRLEIIGNESGIYLDDIIAKKAEVGGADREVWPSKMWVGDAQQLVVDDISLGNFTMFHGSTVAYKGGVKYEMPAPVKEINNVLYVPLRFSAESLGAEVVWNEVEGAVYMMFLGKTMKIAADGTVFVDGVETALANGIKSISGTTYISAADLGTLLNIKVNFENGYVMFGPDWDYYKNTESTVQKELYRMVKYQRPDGETIYNKLLSNNPDKNHPRILGRAEDFARMKSIYESKSDEFANKAFESIIKSSDEYCEQDVTAYQIPSDGVRQHSNSKMRDMITTLGMAYRFTGEEKYAERAREEIMNITTVWPELGEKSTLDIGDNSDIIALAYDWFYDYFTEEDKATIREEVLKKILPLYIACYRGNTEIYQTVKRGWINANDNFNSNLNKGAIMLCLSLGDDFDSKTIEDYIKPILKYSVLSIENFIDQWYPDGAWHEGPGYGTGVIIQMALLLDSIKTACGTDFGFFSLPGIFESGIWALYMEGATGTFNYGDAWEQTDYHQSFFWLSGVLDENLFASKRALELQEGAFSDFWGFEMIWYEPERLSEYVPPEDLDKYFRVLESTVMRSGWDKNDWYAGFHAGDNGIAHSHLDTGSFVLDWAGTRWVKEMGVDSASYRTAHEPGTYYRQRSEGHNTLTIDDTPYKVYQDNEWPIIFEDDFEDYDIDSDPSKFKISETSSDPNGQGEMGVVNVEYSDKDGNKQNKAMHFVQKYDKEKEWSTSYYAQRIFGIVGKSYAKKAVELTFKYKLEKIDMAGEYGTNYVSFYSPATDAVAAVSIPGMRIRKKANSDVYTMSVMNGSAEIPAVATFDPTKWHELKFVLSVEEQNLNVWFDGKQVGSDLVLPAEIAGINYIRLTSSTKGNVSSYVDDFVVRVDPSESEFAKSCARLYDQTLKSASPIAEYVSKPKGAYAITDMTEAFKAWATKVRRGTMLTNNRDAFVVRDEFTLKDKSDVYWAAHSLKKNVAYEISADKKSVILKGMNGDIETGSRMWAGIISDTPNATFEIQECIPMEGSPTPENQADNSGFHKLVVKLAGVEGDVDLAVAFVPLEGEQTMPDSDSIPVDLPLEEWSIPDGERPVLDALTINGVMIENFEPTKTTYNISLLETDAVPVIGAVYQGQAVEVEQPESLYDTSTFSVMSGGEMFDYKVGFNVRKLVYAYIQGNPITDADIKASSTTAEENGPAQIIDQNMETSCSSLGDGEWVLFDFRKACDFSKIEIAWRYGEGRNYKFELLYSNDGINWETAYEGASSGKGSDYETYDFGKTISARYLKLVGHGNNVNLYNNMAEIR